MELQRDLGIPQKTAWHMQQRIREVFAYEGPPMFDAAVDVDETYLGDQRRNTRKHRCEQLSGCGTGGKVAVVGAHYRDTRQVVSTVVDCTTAEELPEGIIQD